MRQAGLTLIELLIVMSIIGILVAAFAFDFTGWRSKYKVESQVKEMHADLMGARMLAMQRNRTYFFHLDPSRNAYTVYEDTNRNDELNIGPDKKVDSLSKDNATGKVRQYRMTWNGPGSDIVFDRRGLIGLMVDKTWQPMLPEGSIWLLRDDGAAFRDDETDYDCVAVSTSRIKPGKYDGTKLPPEPPCQSK